MKILFTMFVAFQVLQVAFVLILIVALRAAGVKIRQIVYGMGPTLLKLGLWKIHAVPTGIVVRMKDSQTENLALDDCADAWDHQPMWIQTAFPLLGPAVLLLFALILLRGEGAEEFVEGFAQPIIGAISPFTKAQEFLINMRDYSEQNSFWHLLALITVKYCAFNLLPICPASGGAALLTLIGFGRPSAKWQDSLEFWLSAFMSMFMLVVSIMWSLAIAAYIWSLVS